MSWLRAIPFLFTLLTFVLQPANASAFGPAHPEARVSAFELVAMASVGASAETSPGLHEGIGRAYDENASGYRFAARGGANATTGLQKQLDKHLKKLEDFKANPDKFDNKGLLKDAKLGAAAEDHRWSDSQPRETDRELPQSDQPSRRRSMKIRVAELRAISDRLFAYLEESGRDEFEVSEDYYWAISKEERQRQDRHLSGVNLVAQAYRPYRPGWDTITASSAEQSSRARR